jgi:hypothetical protein
MDVATVPDISNTLVFMVVTKKVTMDHLGPNRGFGWFQKLSTGQNDPYSTPQNMRVDFFIYC